MEPKVKVIPNLFGIDGYDHHSGQSYVKTFEVHCSEGRFIISRTRTWKGTESYQDVSILTSRGIVKYWVEFQVSNIVDVFSEERVQKLEEMLLTIIDQSGL